MASSVKLFVYDVTRGMARSLGPMLLGRPLDGVWHTGVMAYGNEYFFGGEGITFCPPGNTILGHPDEVVDLGYTEIPQELFHEFLAELGRTSFRGETYHLLDHNCNNFSDEVAQFLTGQKIPEKITNLPLEVLNTPIGQMMRPVIDQMMNQVNAGIHINDWASVEVPNTTAGNKQTPKTEKSAESPEKHPESPADDSGSKTKSNPNAKDRLDLD